MLVNNGATGATKRLNVKLADTGDWVIANPPPHVLSPPSTNALENAASRLTTYDAFVAVACGEISSTAISCLAAEPATGVFVAVPAPKSPDAVLLITVGSGKTATFEKLYTGSIARAVILKRPFSPAFADKKR